MSGAGFRRLVVMRHAKTEAFAGRDRDRRLTERGERDSIAAGRWLAAQDVVPDYVLVSTAARARETFDNLTVGLARKPPVEPLDELYDASVDDCFGLCSVIPDEAACALVIGHNPTMAELAHALQAEPEEDWAPHLPTAGLAVFDCEGDWDDIGAGVGSLTLWHVPRG